MKQLEEGGFWHEVRFRGGMVQKDVVIALVEQI